jgi:predicted house-cleaning noncanonical NTP pyrophosphatase (MazG superfamily)
MGRRKIMKVYNKLVRDKIVNTIVSEGKIVTFRKICTVYSKDEAELALENKLKEEMAEYEESGTTEELVDIMEVCYALARLKGLSRVDLSDAIGSKRGIKGGFDDLNFLVAVFEQGEPVIPNSE